MSKAGTLRLQKEYKNLAKEFEKQINDSPTSQISDNFVAAPEQNDIFKWHFIIFNLPDEPYKGGYYMGTLTFPPEYPWKPPGIRLTTESGRFQVNDRICLSISDYHPESWNPVWPVRSIIIGLISFFVTNDSTVGAIDRSHTERMKIAKESREKILKNKDFLQIFEPMKNNIGLGTIPVKQANPQKTTTTQNQIQIEKEPVNQIEIIKEPAVKIQDEENKQEQLFQRKNDQNQIINELENPQKYLQQPLINFEEKQINKVDEESKGTIKDLKDIQEIQLNHNEQNKKRYKWIYVGICVGVVAVIGAVTAIVISQKQN